MIWGTYESEEHRITTEKLNKTLTGRNAKMGLYNGEPTYCTVNAYSDCPYCDKEGKCHIDDPIADCDDFAAFFESWADWIAADNVDFDAPTDFAEDEIRWAGDVYGYEDTWEDNELE